MEDAFVKTIGEVVCHSMITLRLVTQNAHRNAALRHIQFEIKRFKFRLHPFPIERRWDKSENPIVLTPNIDLNSNSDPSKLYIVVRDSVPTRTFSGDLRKDQSFIRSAAKNVSDMISSFNSKQIIHMIIAFGSPKHIAHSKHYANIVNGIHVDDVTEAQVNDFFVSCIKLNLQNTRIFNEICKKIISEDFFLSESSITKIIDELSRTSPKFDEYINLVQYISERLNSRWEFFKEDEIGLILQSFREQGYFPVPLASALSNHLPYHLHEWRYWNVIAAAEYILDAKDPSLHNQTKLLMTAIHDPNLEERISSELWKLTLSLKYDYPGRAMRVIGSLGVGDKRLYRLLGKVLQANISIHFSSPDLIAQIIKISADQGEEVILPKTLDTLARWFAVHCSKCTSPALAAAATAALIREKSPASLAVMQSLSQKQKDEPNWLHLEHLVDILFSNALVEDTKVTVPLLNECLPLVPSQQVFELSPSGLAGLVFLLGTITSSSSANKISSIIDIPIEMLNNATIALQNPPVRTHDEDLRGTFVRNHVARGSPLQWKPSHDYSSAENASVNSKASNINRDDMKSTTALKALSHREFAMMLRGWSCLKIRPGQDFLETVIVDEILERSSEMHPNHLFLGIHSLVELKAIPQSKWFEFDLLLANLIKEISSEEAVPAAWAAYHLCSLKSEDNNEDVRLTAVLKQSNSVSFALERLVGSFTSHLGSVHSHSHLVQILAASLRQDSIVGAAGLELCAPESLKRFCNLIENHQKDLGGERDGKVNVADGSRLADAASLERRDWRWDSSTAPARYSERRGLDFESIVNMIGNEISGRGGVVQCNLPVYPYIIDLAVFNPSSNKNNDAEEYDDDNIFLNSDSSSLFPANQFHNDVSTNITTGDIVLGSRVVHETFYNSMEPLASKGTALFISSLKSSLILDLNQLMNKNKDKDSSAHIMTHYNETRSRILERRGWQTGLMDEEEWRNHKGRKSDSGTVIGRNFVTR